MMKVKIDNYAILTIKVAHHATSMNCKFICILWFVSKHKIISMLIYRSIRDLVYFTYKFDIVFDGHFYFYL